MFGIGGSIQNVHKISNPFVHVKFLFGIVTNFVWWFGIAIDCSLLNFLAPPTWIASFLTFDPNPVTTLEKSLWLELVHLSSLMENWEFCQAYGGLHL